MLRVNIPDFGILELEHLVTDYTGTLSENGKLMPGIADLLDSLSDKLNIQVITSDTFGTAKNQLEGIDCTIYLLEGERHDLKKADYVKSLGSEKVVALGNGRNDRAMLDTARLGIAVCLKEGCSVEAIESADVLVTSATDALELLVHTKRLIATLRS
jgi:soluble P-type ATPase